MITKIKELVEKEEITGIEDIINKSDKKHLLIEIQCSKAPLTVLNKLFATTDLQKSFSINQYALVSKTPKLLNLKQYLDLYIEHNLLCIKRENEFEIAKAKERKEIVEGLVKALEDIDNIIILIKKSDSSADAQSKLEQKYQFTPNQSKAIVSMRLGTLARLEAIELNQELKDLISNIEKYEKIIQNTDEQKSIFLSRLQKLADKFGSPRKTKVEQLEIPVEEKEIAYVEPEKCVVVMTEAGTIKRIPASSFKAQRRNGKGLKTQAEVTSAVIRTNTIDSLMIFTNQGRMYRLLVNDIPVGTNTSAGQAIKSLVAMEPNEEPAIMYSIYRDTEAKYVFFTTKNGTVKKTELNEYIKTKKKSGIGAISLRDGDELVSVTLIKDEPISLITANGYMLNFKSEEVAPTSRMTIGVKGINLSEGDYVVAGMAIRDMNDNIAVFAEHGLGKRIHKDAMIFGTRGTKGLICYKPTASSGKLVAAALVSDEDNILIIGDKTSICIAGNEIPIVSKTSIGNILIKGKIISVTKV